MPEYYFGTTRCFLIYKLMLYEILSRFYVNVLVLKPTSRSHRASMI